MRNKITAIGAAALFGFSLAAGTANAGQLDVIKARGRLNCGNHTGLPGFGFADEKGAWKGLDIDFCRALAAAIFNDPDKIVHKPTSAKDRFVAVQTGEVDVLARNATYTMSRDYGFGLVWPAINFYDGQAFMLKKKLGIKSAKELNGASVCVTQGTTTELNLADFARGAGIKIEAVAFGTSDETSRAFEAGRCDAFTTDFSGLAAERLRYANPDDFAVLPDLISKEPLGPAVRAGDEQWANIVRWTHYAMLNAEQYGVTQANVDEMRKSNNPEIRRLLGADGTFGEKAGLTNDWAYRIIKHVGNYGESYDRNVGMKSRLQIKRGLNELHTSGGLQYPHPIR